VELDFIFYVDVDDEHSTVPLYDISCFDWDTSAMKHQCDEASLNERLQTMGGNNKNCQMLPISVVGLLVCFFFSLFCISLSEFAV